MHRNGLGLFACYTTRHERPGLTNLDTIAIRSKFMNSRDTTSDNGGKDPGMFRRRALPAFDHWLILLHWRSRRLDLRMTAFFRWRRWSNDVSNVRYYAHSPDYADV